MKNHAYAMAQAEKCCKPHRITHRERRRIRHQHLSRPVPPPAPPIDFAEFIKTAPVHAIIRRGEGFAACPAFEAAGL